MATNTQSASTGNLGSIQNTIIAQMRYTAEHNMPVVGLIEQFTLGKGEKQLDIPKAGQVDAQDLVDGIDLTDSEDINASIVSATTSEVGLKFIITDKLARQFNQDVMAVVGRQAGDAMARKKDTDAIALFSGFSTSLGADNANFTLANATSVIARAKGDKFGLNPFIVHHPNAIFKLTQSLQTPLATYPLPDVFNRPPVKDFFTGVRIGGVPFFEDGNISQSVGDNAGVGVIATQGAMGYITSAGQNVERQRDASLRATEMVMTEDYGMFELDDSKGASLTYEIGDHSTSA
jgi:hypothetical protein|tara:strand:+ start:440 stop:1312 length:873 start_codon:yes stop_codon:yes gene_type:complete